ncbi:DUF418 domain-containing protein [Kitasatospora sp. NBC_00458]|uniref:DUF418 domain-containing protein n=1 Tax=Kitasatospora sp. NBC_00458 TaxID=2903568 RepID=UPI002E188F20
MGDHRGETVGRAVQGEGGAGTGGRNGPARLADVDALRGFALFGILTVNITYLASAYHGTGVDEPGFGSPLDTGVRLLVALLFEAKFFLLFSFLFGYSFTLQLDSAERHGARFTPRFLRRLAGLFALGVLHAVVLFPGDILTTYAVLGLVLLALRRIRPATAVRTAVVLFTVTSAAYGLLALALRGADGGDRAAAAAAADAQRATEALRGGLGPVIGAHLDQLPDVVFLLAFFQAPAALAAFLLGLAAGRHRALADLGRHDRTLRRIQAWGFPVGLLGAAVYTYSALRHPGASAQVFALGVDVVTAPLLAAAYAATVLRTARGRFGRRMVAVLAPAGRMTLTNYLTQSLVCVLVFTGVGAGLVGRVPPPGVALIGVVLFAAQAVFCRRWLARHPYGPVEWLLRAATTLTRPRWRGAADGAPGVPGMPGVTAVPVPVPVPTDGRSAARAAAGPPSEPSPGRPPEPSSEPSSGPSSGPPALG